MIKRQKIKKRQCIIAFMILLPIFVYAGFSLAALYKMDADINNLKSVLLQILSHPYMVEKVNSKTTACVLLSVVVWILCFATAYSNTMLRLMHGEEYGTAEWGDVREFNKKFADANDNENKIYSQNIRMSYDKRTLLNNNIFVVGGSGSGKTAFLVSPNLLNLHGSNVYTDPKGGLLEGYGEYLKKQPDTRVYYLNLCDMKKSMKYNPFVFIRKETDIPKLIRNIMKNTTPEEGLQGSNDPFWDKAENLYLQSIFYYIWQECPKDEVDFSTGEEYVLEKNFTSVLKLLDEAKIDNNGKASKLDIRISRLSEKHKARRVYERFKVGAGDTMRSIIICANSRFVDFDSEDVKNILSDNDIPLNEIGTGLNGDGKTKSYVFLIIPDDDDTFNFIPGMFYTQLFQELYYQASLYPSKSLPVDVGCWFDEFANIKMPANFDKILATCRSRGVYCVPILQSMAQIKKLFKNGDWEGIVSNCDTFIYLGGNEQGAFKYVSELLGKWTIDKKTNGESTGGQGSSSKNYDVIGRDLMDASEIRLLSNDMEIVFVRGERPLMDRKWHPWEYDIYKKAKALGEFNYDISSEISADDSTNMDMEDVEFITAAQTKYYERLSEKQSNVKIYDIDPIAFLKMDLSEFEPPEASEEDFFEEVSKLFNESDAERTARQEEQQRLQEQREELKADWDDMELFEIYCSPLLEKERKTAIKEMLDLGFDEELIKRQVNLDISLEEIQENLKIAKEYKGA